MSILRFKEETNAEKDKYTHNKRIREMNYKLKIYGTLITAIIGMCFNKRSRSVKYRSNSLTQTDANDCVFCKVF